MGATAAILSSATTAYAQMESGRSEERLARQNAAIMDMQAADAIERGRQEEAKHRRGVRRLVGAQRAGFAGQGVVVDQDTAGDLVDESEYLGELDALTIRNNAARDAWGLQTQAQDTRLRGRMARWAGYSAAGGTLATAGGRAAERRYQQRRNSEDGWGGYSNSTGSTARLQGPAR